MASIKLLECNPAPDGIAVHWQIWEDGVFRQDFQANFSTKLSQGGLKKEIARLSREYLEALDTPLNPPDLSDDLGREIPLEDYEDPVTLELAIANKFLFIDRYTWAFIDRKTDGDARYPLQHQMGAMGSLHTLARLVEDASLTAEEREAARTRYNKIIDIWEWLEAVFQAQTTAKQEVMSLGAPATVAAYEFSLEHLEASDPDVFLYDIWARPQRIEA